MQYNRQNLLAEDLASFQNSAGNLIDFLLQRINRHNIVYHIWVYNSRNMNRLIFIFTKI